MSIISRLNDATDEAIKRIEELEKLNEGLGKQLDLEINEQTRQFIEDKMHANYDEKKTLKEQLCK